MYFVLLQMSRNIIEESRRYALPIVPSRSIFVGRVSTFSFFFKFVAINVVYTFRAVAHWYACVLHVFAEY